MWAFLQIVASTAIFDGVLWILFAFVSSVARSNRVCNYRARTFSFRSDGFYRAICSWNGYRCLNALAFAYYMYIPMARSQTMRTRLKNCKRISLHRDWTRVRKLVCLILNRAALSVCVRVYGGVLQWCVCVNQFDFCACVRANVLLYYMEFYRWEFICHLDVTAGVWMCVCTLDRAKLASKRARSCVYVCVCVERNFRISRTLLKQKGKHFMPFVNKKHQIVCTQQPGISSFVRALYW